VQRNLIKRLAREHFRRLPETTAQDALDIVILTRPAARDSSRQDLSAALVRLFQKLGLENTAG
jgi:ribonuclease P protein component